jgi:hypothetical protein
MKYRCVANTLKFCLFLLLLPVTIPSSGQNSNLLKTSSDNNSRNTGITLLIVRQSDSIRRIYSEKVQAPKELINGKEYEPYYTRSKVKPLLFPDRKRTAAIITNTRRYNNLTLQYDTFLDEVIYTDTSRTINYRFPQIALNKDIIEGFKLFFEEDSLVFRYFRLPECSAQNLKEGFYEVVYEGKSRFLIKHKSSFYVREGLNNYKYSPEYLINTGNTFNRIKNRKSLLRLFGDKSGDVKGLIHSSGIRVRKADKTEILSVLKFYDSLKTSE